MSTTPLDQLTAGLSAADLGPTVLVTGARGFVGQRLVEALVHLGCTVRAADLASPGSHSPPGVEPLVADVCDLDAMSAACAGVDTVFHTAARIALHGIGPKHVEEALFQVNVGGTRTLLEAAQTQGVKHLVFTSSHNVVLGREPVHEAHEDSTPYASEFIDIYTPSKIEAERLVLASDTPNGLRTCALRPGGIWGAGGVMMVSFLEQLTKGSLVAFLGKPDTVLDNTHLDNLVRAELLAAAGLSRRPEVVGGQAYFVTDDERINGLSWFAPAIIQLGYKVPTLWLPSKPMYFVGWCLELVYRLGGPAPTITRASIHKVTCSSSLKMDKARAHLGWEPVVQQEDGLRSLGQWLDGAHARMKKGEQP